jgi:hypothetical protein
MMPGVAPIPTLSIPVTIVVPAKVGPANNNATHISLFKTIQAQDNWRRVKV